MIKFNKKYDIPGLAGYSIKGDVYYLDKDTPDDFIYKNKKIKIDRPLLAHEVAEKSLMDKLDLDYETAHELTTAAEKKLFNKIIFLGKNTINLCRN